MILNQLGIYGWKEADENLILASLLTGDPVVPSTARLIATTGARRAASRHLHEECCAFFRSSRKVAQVLGRRLLVYDASKAMFE